MRLTVPPHSVSGTNHGRTSEALALLAGRRTCRGARAWKRWVRARGKGVATAARAVRRFSEQAGFAFGTKFKHLNLPPLLGGLWNGGFEV